MYNKMILTVMTLFLLFEDKNGMDSVSGVQEFLVLMDSGTKRTARNVIMLEGCFYRQRIKLPQLQCILFKVAAGVG